MKPCFVYRVVVPVSIHAPARGATPFGNASYKHRGFQSTPLREGRPVDEVDHGSGNKFQSTPLREGRRHNVLA